MKIDELYPDKWLKASHLQGKTHLVTIAESTVEGLYSPTTKRTERKFVLRFHAKRLRMVLNRTQAHALAAITGENDSDHWPGHHVLIGPAKAPNGADTIRISRPPAPPAATDETKQE